MVSAEVWRSSKTLERRRDQFSQIKVCSTNQLLGRTLTWKNLEQLLVGAFDHLDRVREDMSGPVNHRARAGSVHEHRLDTAEEAK